MNYWEFWKYAVFFCSCIQRLSIILHFVWERGSLELFPIDNHTQISAFTTNFPFLRGVKGRGGGRFCLSHLNPQLYSVLPESLFVQVPKLTKANSPDLLCSTSWWVFNLFLNLLSSMYFMPSRLYKNMSHFSMLRFVSFGVPHCKSPPQMH